MSYAAPTPNVTSVNLLNVTPKEDALFTYLNTPGLSPRKEADSFKSLSTTSSLVVEQPTDDTDSELSIHSDSSPTPTKVTVEMIPNALHDQVIETDVGNTNLYLPTEVQMLDHENVKSINSMQNGNNIYKFNLCN